MSQYLDTLEEGDEITVMGPTGMKTYEGKGTFKVQKGKEPEWVKYRKTN